MKKYLISFIILVLIGSFSCQEEQESKQYFEDCPEIETAKKLTEAFLSQDWETFKSCFSDTAKIWENSWYLSPSMTVEENIEGMKALVSPLYGYTFEETIFEMVITNEGEKCVYFWGKWIGKFSENGDEIIIPVHSAYLFIDNKIIYEFDFFDSLPLYLAQQALEKEDE